MVLGYFDSVLQLFKRVSTAEPLPIGFSSENLSPFNDLISVNLTITGFSTASTTMGVGVNWTEDI